VGLAPGPCEDDRYLRRTFDSSITRAPTRTEVQAHAVIIKMGMTHTIVSLRTNFTGTGLVNVPRTEDAHHWCPQPGANSQRGLHPVKHAHRGAQHKGGPNICSVRPHCTPGSSVRCLDADEVAWPTDTST
jgi:hypothetical protein